MSMQRGTMGELVPLIEQTVADNPGLPVIRRRAGLWPTWKRIAPTMLDAC